MYHIDKSRVKIKAIHGCGYADQSSLAHLKNWNDNLIKDIGIHERGLVAVDHIGTHSSQRLE